MDLEGFTSFEFSANGYRHKVYKKGDDTRPGVMVIQELPGILPETIEFAERLHRDGYTVYMPHLFGVVNKKGGAPLQNLAKLCVSLEFRLLATKRKSPVADWLRSLARHMKEKTGGSVAAIGMCFTGSFALALMMDDTIAAPVVCQPGHVDGVFGAAQRSSLGVSDDEIKASVIRSEKENIPVIGFRFTNDVIPLKAHSVFTVDYVDEPGHPTRKAYETLLDFLGERLMPAASMA